MSASSAPADSFARLSPRVQVARLRAVAQRALAAFGLQDATFRLVKFEDNALYRVVAPNGACYGLRVIVTDEMTAGALRSQLCWLQALQRDTGLTVPEPAAARDGGFVVSIDEPGLPRAHCCLLSWLRGRDLMHEATPRMLTLAGEATGKLHAHARGCMLPDGFVRPRYDLETLAAQVTAACSPSAPTPLTPHGRALMAQGLACLRSALGGLSTDAPGFGLIHADLNPGNFLFGEGRIAVIDFDDCSFGWYLYDLAVPLLAMRRLSPDLASEARLQAAFLSGYDRVRRLSPGERALLPAFLTYRQLVLLYFYTTSTNKRVQAWAPGPIAAVLQRLQNEILCCET